MTVEEVAKELGDLGFSEYAELVRDGGRKMLKSCSPTEMEQDLCGTLAQVRLEIQRMEHLLGQPDYTEEVKERYRKARNLLEDPLWDSLLRHAVERIGKCRSEGNWGKGAFQLGIEKYLGKV